MNNHYYADMTVNNDVILEVKLSKDSRGFYESNEPGGRNHVDTDSRSSICLEFDPKSKFYRVFDKSSRTATHERAYIQEANSKKYGTHGEVEERDQLIPAYELQSFIQEWAGSFKDRIALKIEHDSRFPDQHDCFDATNLLKKIQPALDANRAKLHTMLEFPNEVIANWQGAERLQEKNTEVTHS